ncbi:MAG: hydrogenase expression/formation protein HypE [Actinobacteria bacterium]|nr:hydrogenase expression/formation protein HypE [Actinomycetota bacterium]
MKKITLAHGAGGNKSRELIEKVFVSRFGNPELGKLADGAALNLAEGNYALSTDTHVIEPIFFSGGDIGKLAVCGSINDVVVCGAKPKWMSCGFVLEEGFDISELERIADSMAEAAASAGVKIVTGDTKVVGPGQADKIYINTTAVGQVMGKYEPKAPAAGDKVIVTGPVGQHGAAIFNDREKLLQNSQLVSDCASLDWMLGLIEKFSETIKIMRDPTRGGLAVVLNELVGGSSCGIEIVENDLPVTEATKSLCDLVGFDAFYLPCEGRAVVIVGSDAATDLLADLRSCEAGKESAIIGTVLDDARNRVSVKTGLGGSRVLTGTAELMLPRIC